MLRSYITVAFQNEIEISACQPL